MVGRGICYTQGLKLYLAPSFVGEPSSPLGYLRRYTALLGADIAIGFGPMKISIKWLLLLTVFMCFHLSLSMHSILPLLGTSSVVMLLVLPAVVLCRWRIADDNGWWKFQGSKFARIYVWAYFVGFMNILICVLRIGMFGLPSPF